MPEPEYAEMIITRTYTQQSLLSWTYPKEKEILADMQAGKTAIEIRRKYKCGGTTVEKLKVKHGLSSECIIRSRNRRGLPPARIMEDRRMHSRKCRICGDLCFPNYFFCKRCSVKFPENRSNCCAV